MPAFAALRCCALGAILSLAAAPIAAQTIGTVFGGPIGDGGPAAYAQIAPMDMVYDHDGNLWIAEGARVRKIRALDGTIETVAGNGFVNYVSSCDDGRSATNSLACTGAIAFDANGTLYIADSSCIERVAPDGTLQAIAGTNEWGFSGDGGPATAAHISDPSSLAFDAQGNLFFSDIDNNRVRKIDTNGTITTVAGSATTDYVGDGGPATQAGLFQPMGLAIDGAGNLYIADSDHFAVRRVDRDGVITTVARLWAPPYGLDFDAQGRLLIGNSAQVLRLESDSTTTALAGDLQFGPWGGDGQPATSVVLFAAWAVTHDADNRVVFSELGNSRVRRIDAQGILHTIAGGAGYPPGTPVATASLWAPNRLAFDVDGSLLVNDYGNRHVRRVRRDNTVTTIAGNGFPPDWNYPDGPALQTGLHDVVALVADADGVFIADGPRLRLIDRTGSTRTLLQGSWDAGCSTATVRAGDTDFALWVGGIARLPQKNSLVISDGCNLLRVWNKDDGTLTTLAGNTTAGFSGDGGPATEAELNYPADVAVDALGNVYVADSRNERVRKIDTNGVITTVAGNGVAGFSGDGGRATEASLNYPQGVAVADDGTLYVADSGNDYIRRVDRNGTITTLAGNGAYAFGGDGGPLTAASFAFPSAVALHDGVLYVADQNNNRVRRIVLDGIFSAGFDP